MSEKTDEQFESGLRKKRRQSVLSARSLRQTSELKEKPKERVLKIPLTRQYTTTKICAIRGSTEKCSETGPRYRPVSCFVHSRLGSQTNPHF